MDNIVRERLNSFLQKHIPQASLSDLDDVVLDYVTEVLLSLKDQDESSFDVDQLCEMIAAYVPEFTQVDSAVVCEWVFEVAHQLQTVSRQGSPPHEQGVHLHTVAGNDKANVDEESESLQQLRDTQSEKIETCVSSVDGTEQQSDKSSVHTCQLNGEIHTVGLVQESIDPDKLSLLMEVFPDLTENDIIGVLHHHRGDMELSIQTLLERCDSSQNGQRTPPPNRALKPHLKKDLVCPKDDGDLKNTILQKYAFVDTKEDKRSHRPYLPAQESKKLVRYRDNQVVNTKGERFTVVTKKDQEGEEMKKTYVNIKPLRKYRFH